LPSGRATRIANASAQQNRQLSALLDAVEESAVVFGPDGRVLYCNRRASQIMRETVGVTRPEIIGGRRPSSAFPASW
jgi:PAS domain-containing protein